MHYSYTILDPRPTDAAREANERVFAAGPVYGLEVTVPGLASRCADNLDPQHLGGEAGTAAIAAALEWPLPPHGATLATVRPDADSIGAMAILTLRREQLAIGYEGETLIDTVFRVGTTPVQGGPGMWERIGAIAEADREASGPWPGPRPIGDAASLLRPTTAVEAMCFDHKLTMEKRVQRMRLWLLTGDFEGMDAYQERALEEAEQALADLQVEVRLLAVLHRTGRLTKEQALANPQVEVRGQVAIVTGTHRLAMSIGYRYAPVVVATNPAFRWQGGPEHLKHTVARWNTSTCPGMDWTGMTAALNEADPAARLTPAQADAYHRELTAWVADIIRHTDTRDEDMPVPPAPPIPRWAGSTSIIGSPQGIGSLLSTDGVTDIVDAHMR